MSDHDAVILRDHSDWARNTVRLLIRERVAPSMHAYLLENGTWQNVAEGQAPTDAGLILPAGAIEPLALAIAEFQGHVSHADTEARVLREWLAVERGRVDKALGRSGGVEEMR